MTVTQNRTFRTALPALCAFAAGIGFAPIRTTQNPEIQLRVAEIKEPATKNKQALSQHIWVEQAAISLKGKQKKQERFQVPYDPDGRSQKTSLDVTVQFSRLLIGQNHFSAETIYGVGKQLTIAIQNNNYQPL
ncbi:MAG: hypothetical protein WAK48_32790 [Candidatus Acidiferrum sp.]|jgi:hypothetical protein